MASEFRTYRVSFLIFANWEFAFCCADSIAISLSLKDVLGSFGDALGLVRGVNLAESEYIWLRLSVCDTGGSVDSSIAGPNSILLSIWRGDIDVLCGVEAECV